MFDERFNAYRYKDLGITFYTDESNIAIDEISIYHTHRGRSAGDLSKEMKVYYRLKLAQGGTLEHL